MFCAGFELASWRCDALADHLIEWIADYALHEDELKVNHGNMYVRLREAAARIYTSKKYGRRGEVGEIALHAICRDFFGTVPIAPRVFYLTSSNDVVKSFDMVHVRYVNQVPELWLGEAKFYANGVEGARAAVTSLTEHLDQGFLRNEKLILGPQISKNIPEYAQIRELLSSQTSLDRLFQNAIFSCFHCLRKQRSIESQRDLRRVHLRSRAGAIRYGSSHHIIRADRKGQDSIATSASRVEKSFSRLV